MISAEQRALQAPPPDLLGLLRNMYPGYLICHHVTGQCADQWTAHRRAAETPQSRQVGIVQYLEAATGHLLADVLADQLALTDTVGFHRWTR